jgi:hypothetical protein
MRGIAAPFCSPAARGSCREATEGVFLSDSVTVEANTPSAPSGHLPRGTGEEKVRMVKRILGLPLPLVGRAFTLAPSP